MNILAISTLYPTPDMPHHGLFVHNRLAAMHAEPGIQVTVLNPIPTSVAHRVLSRYKGQQSAPPHRVADGMQIHHPRYRALPGLFKDKEHLAVIKAIRPFAESMHQTSPFDCIDVHWTYPDLPLGIALSEAWGVPCRVTLRGMEAFYTDDDDQRKHIIAKSLARATHVISLSKEMADFAHLIAKTGNRTTIVTNGSDTHRFSYTPQAQARQQLGLREDADILLGVGALIKRKGFHHVVDAMSIMKEQQPTPQRPVLYYILGAAGMEGDFEKSLRSKINEAGLSQGMYQVILQGKVDNSLLPLWYNAASIFCLSSSGEGSPNVLTEALSTGCPAIAHDVGAVMDIMSREKNSGIVLPNRHGQNTHLVPTKKIEYLIGLEWASAIQNILRNWKSDRCEQSHRMAKYTWAWCAQQALNVICSTKG